MQETLDIEAGKTKRYHSALFDANNRDIQLREETIAAMIEAERIALDPSAKSYTVDEAFEELEKD